MPYIHPRYPKIRGSAPMAYLESTAQQKIEVPNVTKKKLANMNYNPLLGFSLLAYCTFFSTINPIIMMQITFTPTWPNP